MPARAQIAAVRAAFPSVRADEIVVLGEGWASIALEAAGIVFRFPRNAAAAASLRREAGVLAAIRPAATLPVPDLTLHEGPPLFSSHPKIPGDQLLTPRYDALPGVARDRLAAGVAGFLAGLHALPAGRMTAAGAVHVAKWPDADEILAGAGPALPAELRAWAEETVAAWREMPADPHGEVFGFFDAHGWNMAFDHETQALNGIYDFGDSGFGELHREFVQPALISPDFARRLADAYEAGTGRPLDRRRIAILTGVLRLAELAGHAGDPAHAPGMIANVAAWATREIA